MMRKCSISLLILLSTGIYAFKQPNIYCQKSTVNSTCKNQVEIVANRLDSVESIVSYEYDDLGFCPGDNQSLPYKFDFLKNVNCHHVCTRKFSSSDINQQKMLKYLMKGIVLNYRQHWIIDNIPVKLCYRNVVNQEICTRSFPIGCYVTKSGDTSEFCNNHGRKKDTFYMFNHLDFEIIYHTKHDEANRGIFASRIIAARVWVNSLNSKYCERNAEPMMFQSTTEDVEIPFTYSVKFVKKKDIPFEQDYRLPKEKFSIFNSYFIILLLLVVIGLIFLILLYKNTAYHIETIGNVNKKNISKELEKNAKNMLNKDFQIGIILLIGCIMTFLGSFSLLSPGILMLCCIIIFMMSDGVERWQRIVIVISSFIFIVLFLLNRIPWKTDGLRDISFIGFLFVLYIILIIAYAQTTTFLFYFLKHAEKLNCIWRLCLTLTFIAVYLFLYSVGYFATNLDISDGASTFFYSDNTSIFIYDLFLLTGILGFLACFWFIRTIYDSIEANKVNKMAAIWTI